GRERDHATRGFNLELLNLTTFERGNSKNKRTRRHLNLQVTSLKFSCGRIISQLSQWCAPGCANKRTIQRDRVRLSTSYRQHRQSDRVLADRSDVNLSLER